MSALQSPAPTVDRRPHRRLRTTDGPDAGNGSIRTASLVAGIGLLAMAVLTPYAHFFVLGGLVTPGDPVRTMEAIAGSEGLFRSGVLSFAVVAVLDVVVTAALFRLFSPVSQVLSMFAAWLRLTYSAVLMAGVGMLAGVLPLSGDPDQTVQRIDGFYDVWHAGLILFGVHLIVIGYLAYRSGAVPRVIGLLLVLAGAGYLFDRFGALALSDYSLDIATFTGPGEVALVVWLLVRGVRATSPVDRPVPDDRAAAL